MEKFLWLSFEKRVHAPEVRSEQQRSTSTERQALGEDAWSSRSGRKKRAANGGESTYAFIQLQHPHFYYRPTFSVPFFLYEFLSNTM